MSPGRQTGSSQDAQTPRLRERFGFSVLAFLLLIFPFPFALEVGWGWIIAGLFPCLRGDGFFRALMPPLGLPWIYLSWRL